MIVFRTIGLLAAMVLALQGVTAFAQEQEDSGDLSEQGGDTEIAWISLEQAQEMAKTERKKVFVYLEADWCGYCNKVEREVFPRQDVQAMMEKYYYPVRVDIESDNIISFGNEKMTEEEFAGAIGLSGTPTYLFIDSDGEILGKQPGFLPENVFRALLSYVGTDAYGKIGFEDYLKNEFNN